MQNSLNEINSMKKSHIINYTSFQGKTRLESLIERIQSANKEIKSFLGNSNQVKNPPKKEIGTSSSTNKPQTELKDIISEDNNKAIQVGLDENDTIENNEDKKLSNENENQESKENDNNINNNNKQENIIDLDIETPFIKKTKSLLDELKKLKENGEIKEDDINNEMTELPKRAMIEMSLSDFKIKKKYELIKKELDKKNEYIKKLETEIVNQRELTNDLKKSEGEYLLKISALEDELRVMKSKLLGYNTSEEFNHHIHSHQKFNTDTNNCGHIYGEKLVQSMWVRDNISNKILNNNEIDNNHRPILNKGERWDAPWISQPMGNMNRVLRNINHNRNNNYELGQFKTDGRQISEIGEKNNFNNNNEKFSNLRLNNNYYDFNGGNSNFQRVSGMILGSPNKMKLSKNYNNEFNRFRIGNNNNNNF